MSPSPSSSKNRIGIIGAGVMGQALIKGLLHSKTVLSSQLWAATQSIESAQKVSKLFSIPCITHFDKTIENSTAVILCTKPKQTPIVLAKLIESGLPKKTLIISIAAGITLSQLEEKSEGRPVIRAMPNTPSLVGQGMTALCHSALCDSKHLKLAHKLFDAVGETIELFESNFDAVTGLSGSGPAFCYLVMESLIDGGVRVGLPREVAKKLVVQTVLGSATMLKDSGQHPAALKDDVTTPAGCTIGALLLMEDGKIRSVLARAVEEATRIAKGLGQTSKS